MKKIISLILIIGVLLTGMVVFAETASEADAKARISEKLQNIKERAAEVKHQLEKIRLNRAELQKLRVEAKTAYQKAKSKVKELRKNKDSLTPEQIEELKQAVSTIKQDKEQLAATAGDIHKESLLLRAAKKDKNIEAYRQSLDNIINVQSTRIDALKKMIDDMNKILSI